MTANLFLFTTVVNLLPLRIIRSMVRHVKYFLGLRFEVSGWEHLQTEGPYVIISNHQSSLDVLGVYCSFSWMFCIVFLAHLASVRQHTDSNMKCNNTFKCLCPAAVRNTIERLWLEQQLVSSILNLPHRSVLHSAVHTEFSAHFS